jgi:hypothetical protein
MPKWFKVGAKIWFRGFGSETEVLSINETEGSWIGCDDNGEHLYPLDEVNAHWKPNYDHPDKGVIIQ